MDLSERAIDGVAPRRIERPTDAAAVAATIGAAHRSREALVLWGGGTRIGIGEAPERYDIALELGALRGVVEHSAPDLVCIVRAGTTLGELARALAPHRQRWPVDAALPERATVGGTIASAAPAASRLRHQHVRDWVIGCEAVLGDGTRVRAGGRVVKNVTGYDLSRLYSGSYGSLAALTEVSLKLVAQDETCRTLRLEGPVADLVPIALDLRRTLPLDAIVLRTGREPALYVRASGMTAAVERVATEIGRRGTCAAVDEAEWSALQARPALAETAARLAVPPGRETDVVGADGVAFIGTGIAYTFADSLDALRSSRERCEAMGGALVLERASSERKRALGVWGAARGSGTVGRSLKERFDPQAVLAPGRMPV